MWFLCLDIFDMGKMIEIIYRSKNDEFEDLVEETRYIVLFQIYWKYDNFGRLSGILFNPKEDTLQSIP